MVPKKLHKNLLKIALIVFVAIGVSFKLNLFATSGNLLVQVQRLMEVVQAVNKFYFEEIDAKKIVDGAITGLLEELDPHSIYIPSDRMQEVNEQFEGEFEGIGIEFIVHNEIPVIISAIAGSPSERVGLRSGDKIISIEGKPTFGINDNEVREKLLGPKGTEVSIRIQRFGLKAPFDVTIVRDRIPIQSITTAFKLDEKTAYIRVGRFAKTTNEEFTEALYHLNEQGMQRLIIDLRGNSGGYLDQAVEMADKFLEGGKRIVYTRGRIPGSNADYYSTGTGVYFKLPLILLIDHGSASAAEIVSGAIQDWDRGLIVGKTSFGKGLVQHQIILKDGSAVRVTIARYYTPTGRLIQRSYNNGVEDYVERGFDELDPNANPDSTVMKPVFTTNAGRKVFGGGGITPDVKLQFPQLSATTISLIHQQIFFECGAEIAKKHSGLADEFNSYKNKFVVTKKMIDELLQTAKNNNIEVAVEEFQKDLLFVQRRLKSQIARHLWGADEYLQVEAVGDPEIKQALKLFPKAAKIAKLIVE